ncbi:type II secretion system F family protein [Erwinia sp.]|uniref:type II secretion system F family protein n=1 Tax=Erwinia citreus TaxID=558 RepID=UPI003C71FFF2
MIFFYLLMVMLGSWIGFRFVRQQRRVARQRQLIDNHHETELQTRRGTLDLRALIVADVAWLLFLQRLDQSLSQKLLLSCGITVGLIALKLIGLIRFDWQSAAISLLLLMMIGIVTPAILLTAAVNTRTKKMSAALPYFIDLLAVCVQAGMTVENALKFTAWRSDDIDPVLTGMMQQLAKRAEVSGLEEALTDLYHSVDLTELRMFCAILQQSVHYGTSLYENLIELSQDIREMQLLIAEEKIGKLGARMSIPLILFIMFPVTVLIAAPGVLRIMNNAIF